MDAIDREWLKDMLEYAQSAVRVLGSTNIDELVANEEKFLAVTYALQIVGEAASKVSPQARGSLLAQIDWVRVIAMRHRLVHGYRTRSAEIIVQTVRNDLPPLIAHLARVISESAS